MTLVSLRVRDLATVADVTLELAGGLNVLTGETGAGKSMLVDAIALLLGDRADRAAVRPTANRAVIEGVFDAIPATARALLEAAGVEIEESLVLRREVTAEGRSRAWINGSATTVGALARLGEAMVDLHGQHQTIQLLEPSVQRDLLDAFGDALPLARAVATAHAELEALRAEAADLAARRDVAQRRADWLRHIITEIDAAKPRPDEDISLDREVVRLGHAGALGDHARQMREALDGDDGSARDAIARAERSLNALERLDDSVAPWRELLDAAYAQLDELARLADSYASELAEDPARLDSLERRRDALYALKQKHGTTLADVLSTRNEARAELDLLDSATLDLRTFATRIGAAETALATIAAELSARRQQAGEQLGREANRLLPRLGLAGGELTVALEPQATIGTNGAEAVTLMVRLNRGMAALPLARVASGGELSRLMLALKVVLARHDAVPTLVFDEVDQGIGGEVGARVGEALSQIGERHQVLVITHLPQIAARADHHLRVAKATRGGIATSDVVTLFGEDRVLEVARMLGDADDDAARRLAQSLLRGAATA
ncbi:MAG: DNA repair protein RecN [Gemmatimonadales bacterium]